MKSLKPFHSCSPASLLPRFAALSAPIVDVAFSTRRHAGRLRMVFNLCTIREGCFTSVHIIVVLCATTQSRVVHLRRHFVRRIKANIITQGRELDYIDCRIYRILVTAFLAQGICKTKDTHPCLVSLAKDPATILLRLETPRYFLVERNIISLSFIFLLDGVFRRSRRLRLKSQAREHVRRSGDPGYRDR